MNLVNYIAFADANAALDFYEQKLGATNVERVLADEKNYEGLGVAFEEAEGKVMHAAFNILNQPVYCSDVFNDGEISTNVGMVFRFDGKNEAECDDAKELFDKAVASDCQILMPLQETFWSPLYGMFKDPFGVKWMINAE